MFQKINGRNNIINNNPDFIYIENNNDNIDFFELSDVNSVNILESLNIPVGRINKDSVNNHYGSRLLDLCNIKIPIYIYIYSLFSVRFITLLVYSACYVAFLKQNYNFNVIISECNPRS
jgi:hypothetical protein